MALRSLVLCVALLAATATAASAQSVTEVPAGSTFSVRNGTECMPNIEVDLAFDQAGTSVGLGSTISDTTGHFELDATLPQTAALGVAQVSAACGLDDMVLVFDVVVVASADSGILGVSPVVIAGLAAAVLALAALAWRLGSNESDDDSEAQEAPSEAVAQAVAAPETEHEPDYWFWDAVTENGPVKRVACLSDLGFYLHESPEEDFGPLLEVLAEEGPDSAFASSFVAIEIAAIDKVDRRGSQLRFVYTDGNERLARIVDLGEQADGVVDLLSRRVTVVAPSQLAAT